jgi:hypothetical protein
MIAPAQYGLHNNFLPICDDPAMCVFVQLENHYDLNVCDDGSVHQ